MNSMFAEFNVPLAAWLALSKPGISSLAKNAVVYPDPAVVIAHEATPPEPFVTIVATPLVPSPRITILAVVVELV